MTVSKQEVGGVKMVVRAIGGLVVDAVVVTTEAPCTNPPAEKDETTSTRVSDMSSTTTEDSEDFAPTMRIFRGGRSF